MAELQKATEIGHRLKEQLERTGDASIAAEVGDVMSQIDAMVAVEVTSDGLEAASAEADMVAYHLGAVSETSRRYYSE